MLGACASFGVLPAAAQVSAEYQRAYEAMRGDLNDPAAAFRFAVIAVETGDIVAAIAALEQVLRADPSRDNIRADLGYLYLRAGNPVLAERYLREARESGTAPEFVEQRIDALLERAMADQDGTRVNGTLTFGAKYETNATAGPDIAGLVSGGAEEDFSILASAGLNLRHDLGFQSGAYLDAGLDLFTAQYGKASSPENSFIGLNFGLGFPLSAGRMASPYLFTNHVRLRSEPYRNEWGLGFRFSGEIDQRSSFRVDLRVAEQTFAASAANPNLDELDGTSAEISLDVRRILAEDTTLDLGLVLGRKEAAVSYESYAAGGLNLRVLRDLEPRTGASVQRPWRVGFGLSYRTTAYDSPDPAISLSRSRSDDNLSAELLLQVPLTAHADVVGSLSWTDNSSSYMTEEYDNLGAFVGVRLFWDDAN